MPKEPVIYVTLLVLAIVVTLVPIFLSDKERADRADRYNTKCIQAGGSVLRTTSSMLCIDNKFLINVKLD